MKPNDTLLTAERRQWFRLVLASWMEQLHGWASAGQNGAQPWLLQVVDATWDTADQQVALQPLLDALSQGQWDPLPAISVVSPSSLPEAVAAYAAADSGHPSGQILLRADWLNQASAEEVHDLLNHEFGHHLDALLQPDDSPGDEGSRFATALQTSDDLPLPTSPVRDQGVWWADDQRVPVEQASLVQREPLPVASPGRTDQEQRNRAAFAALKSDGSVVAWGDPDSGGDISGVAERLRGDVTQIFSSAGAFTALKGDGSVVSWGDSGRGGVIPPSLLADLDEAVVRLASNDFAFAAVTQSGAVVSWGDASNGGYSRAMDDQLASGVVEVFASQSAFAALKQDGSVVTWGRDSAGGDSSAVSTELSSGVVEIVSSDSAFAALKDDGSVVSWGNPAAGGNSNLVADQLAAGVASITANNSAFAAVLQDGSITSWGNRFSGGRLPSAVNEALSTGANSITASSQAFAALGNDGSVISWGHPDTGGNSSAVSEQITTDVVSLTANETAFAALKRDGSVVSWGNAAGGGDSSAVSEQLQGDVLSLAATDHAFTALKTDGSLVSWGDAESGGVTPTLLDSRTAAVNEVIANDQAFAARLADGSVISWGDAAAGGDSSAVADQLQADVVGFADPFHDDMLRQLSAQDWLDFDGDTLVNPLSDHLVLAAAIDQQPAPDPLIAGGMDAQRLDLDGDAVVGEVDTEILLRFSFGTFPDAALTHDLPVERPETEVWQQLMGWEIP